MRRLVFLAAALLLLLPLSIHAQEGESTPEANALDINANFYNNAAGWHVFIPSGWANESTADYARFTHDGRMITVREYPGLDAPAAAAQILVDAGLSAETPLDQRDLQLSNGTWTQFVYSRAVVHTQEYEGTRYAMLYAGDASALPVIVMREGVLEDAALIDDGMIEAARLITPTISGAATAETIPQGTGNVTVHTYDGGLTAIGRARGSSVYIVVGSGDTDALNSASVYFTVLNDFFLTPDTQPYLFLGLGVASAIMLILLLSLILRWRSLLRDEAALRELDEA